MYGGSAASNINIGAPVAYLIYLSRDGNNMEISILNSDNNLDIFISERVNWSFNESNKALRRVL